MGAENSKNEPSLAEKRYKVDRPKMKKKGSFLFQTFFCRSKRFTEFFHEVAMTVSLERLQNPNFFSKDARKSTLEKFYQLWNLLES
ncbi:hypothetical protein Aduo_019758 [Ancylostoma duodenale]